MADKPVKVVHIYPTHQEAVEAFRSRLHTLQGRGTAYEANMRNRCVSYGEYERTYLVCSVHIDDISLRGRSADAVDYTAVQEHVSHLLHAQAQRMGGN